MSVQLNIKNPDAVRLVDELARAEGMSRTRVVLEALRAWKRERESESVYQEALRICRDTAPRLPETQLSLTHGDLLYDENGLPA